jgi:dephospho-CoA kinase
MLLESFIANAHAYQRFLSWLYPIVKSRMYASLLKTKAKAVLIEVPLLFQSHLDAYCDVIIGVEMNSKLQKERLHIREKNQADRLWLLNERNHYLDYVHWIDHRVDNNQSLQTWELKSKTILKPYLKYL